MLGFCMATKESENKLKNILKIKGGFQMNKMLRNRKGFSLVELLIALLIMAVIAAVAITLFGGVLGSSKVSADKETAENIKRQVLLYMNQSNDVGLLETGTVGTVGAGAIAGTKAATTDQLITNLSAPLILPADATTGDGPDGTIAGSYGPYFDSTKKRVPQQTGMQAWAITVKISTQAVTVVPVALAANGTVTVNP